MKRYTALLTALLAALLTGCASRKTESVTALGSVSGDQDSRTVIAEIAVLTRESPQEMTEPPHMQVTYSDDTTASAAVMTLGSYSWESGGKTNEVISEPPGKLKAEGRITAEVDLDLITEGPRINLSGGAVLNGAQLIPANGSDNVALEYADDGTILFPEDITGGIAEVSLSFEQGEAVYYFTVSRSLSDPPDIWATGGNF